jgi:hypothetical protein
MTQLNQQARAINPMQLATNVQHTDRKITELNRSARPMNAMQRAANALHTGGKMTQQLNQSASAMTTCTLVENL